MEIADQLTNPTGSRKVVTRLEGHQYRPLDVLEYVATQLVETKGAWRSLVTHSVEMPQERIDRG